jgi:hypothetical protein
LPGNAPLNILAMITAWNSPALSKFSREMLIKMPFSTSLAPDCENDAKRFESN